MTITRRLRRDEGLSLLEVTGAMVVLLVAITALAGVVVSESRLAEEVRENAVLTATCRNVFEVLRAEDFSTLSANYGTGTARPQFWCSQSGDVLFADPGNASVSGTIEFFTREDSVPNTFGGLLGSVLGGILGGGGGIDLDLDGSIESAPVSDYKILPTRVTLTITTLSAQRTIVVERILRES